MARCHRIGLSVAVAVLAFTAAIAGGRQLGHSPSNGAFAGRPVPAKALLSAALLSAALLSAALLSAALGRDDHAFLAAPSPGGFTVGNARQELAARFSRGRVLVRSGAAQIGLSLHSYGAGDQLGPLAAVQPHAHANRVTYARGPVSEWYVNGPRGLEQGFTLKAPPAGRAAGPLTLALTLSGNAVASLSRRADTVTFAYRGESLAYRGLAASDADGRSLPAWMALRGRELLRPVTPCHCPICTRPSRPGPPTRPSS